MKRLAGTILIVTIGLLLVITTGCATHDKMPRSGFLSDYSLIRQGDPMMGKADWTYVNKSAIFGAYDKILLDHVVFYFNEDAAYKGIHADELHELSEAFHLAVIQALSDVYTFTDKRGPGVMELRLAITDLVPNKPVMGTVTTIVPVGLAASAVKKGVTGSHIGMGEVSFEGELLDAQTNQVLAAAIDKKVGKKYRIDKGITKWGHHKNIFKDWAKTLRNRLDRLGGRK